MADRPILMSAPMVRAILAGTKTQTRRVVKPVGRDGGFVIVEERDGSWWPRRSDDGESCFVTVRERGGDYLHEIPMACPYGSPGDRLWVREAWRTEREFDHLPPRDLNPTWPTPIQCEAGPYADVLDGKLRPGMFMPRWASRITLEVTGVRVERLQEISRGDAMAEGCPSPNMAAGPDPRQWYAELWDQINGPGSWDANPWVWIVEFKRAPQGSKEGGEMSRRRFRWTRERYRKAEHLSRFFARWGYDLPSEPPRLLQRFQELWERHPQREDPLLTPLKWRLDDPEIPF